VDDATEEGEMGGFHAEWDYDYKDYPMTNLPSHGSVARAAEQGTDPPAAGAVGVAVKRQNTGAAAMQRSAAAQGSNAAAVGEAPANRIDIDEAVGSDSSASDYDQLVKIVGGGGSAKRKIKARNDTLRRDIDPPKPGIVRGRIGGEVFGKQKMILAEVRCGA